MKKRSLKTFKRFWASLGPLSISFKVPVLYSDSSAFKKNIQEYNEYFCQWLDTRRFKQARPSSRHQRQGKECAHLRGLASSLCWAFMWHHRGVSSAVREFISNVLMRTHKISTNFFFLILRDVKCKLTSISFQQTNLAFSLSERVAD